MSQHAFQLSDLFRRMENLIRRGTVAELDLSKARLRVAIGETDTDWVPWMTLRAGADRTWVAPSVGEQVLLLSESGDYRNGIAFFGFYQDAHPAPDEDGDVTSHHWEDGAIASYDKGAHVLEIELPETGEFSFKVGRTILSLRDSEVTLTTPNFRGVRS